MLQRINTSDLPSDTMRSSTIRSKVNYFLIVALFWESNKQFQMKNMPKFNDFIHNLYTQSSSSKIKSELFRMLYCKKMVINEWKEYVPRSKLFSTYAR